ncbi:MAG: radical SAM protein [Candidatus Accumulibacter sp.]|jgi:uncharacterized protein|nr:radical SAM protein [Accumulibacter sp.]
MELYTLPYKDKAIIYRPLQQLAFIGNQAMVRLCAALSGKNADNAGTETEADFFLRTVGFFEEDTLPADSTAVSDKFQPTVCVLFLTDACNLRCIYCYARGGGARETRALSLPLARAAVDTVCRNAMQQGRGHYSLCFHGGGEPTAAWPFLKDCVAYARKSPLRAKINLTSNGVWTEAQRVWILDNIDEISLSFDGPPSIQNAQRPRKNGKGSHASVERTLRALDRKGSAYGIRVTVTDETVARIPEIVDYLCRETGAPAFQVEPAFAHGRARVDRVALQQQDDFAEFFMKGYDIANRHQRHMYYSGARPWLLTNRFCDAYINALIVGPDGFLTACYEICNREHELAKDFIFGDLETNGSIRLTPGARQGFLAKIEERRQHCKSCFCFYHCAGDCPSKTFSGGADGHLAYGDRCESNRTITRELLVRYIEEGGGVWQGRRGRFPCEDTV